ncbi:MAG TPA: peptide chain release factor N(5)-glutamine methyltransferase [Gemmataceae bacterium]
MATEPAENAWSISRLLSWTEQYLRQKGIESPRLEAQILLAHVLQVPPIQLYVRSEEPTSEETRSAFKALLKRRVEGCPVAHLVGYREFYKLRFDVSPAVLVPRPETELLVMKALELIKGRPGARVLDVGTGSGCIAVSIAHQAGAADVTATDVSPAALEVARANAARHGLGGRIRFLEGDLFGPVPRERFDLIVSNPPYIAEDEFPLLAAEVREHDPRQALAGGLDGLSVLRPLIAQAPEHLTPGGHLLVEIGYKQEEAVRGLFEAAGFQLLKTLKDAAGHPRVIGGRWDHV